MRVRRFNQEKPATLSKPQDMVKNNIYGMLDRQE